LSQRRSKRHAKRPACAAQELIKLRPDDREEVVQDGLTPIEAEILRMARMSDIPRTAQQQIAAPVDQETATPARQLRLRI
jgi:hypothetical protein